MNFRPRRNEEPEINLIPFIDILLVVLIFLVLTTTYSKHTEIQLTLPVADTENQREYPKELIVTVSADGSYTINRSTLMGRSLETLADALLDGAKGNKDTVIVIHADASAKHQSVITVMEAARRAGLGQITFATQSSSQAQASSP
jgi:biopolymer transport protein ExbD